MKINRRLLTLIGATIISSLSFGAIKIAYVAGGCFWCTEADMEKVPGVLEVISGYSGGKIANPTYKQVSAGNTGHLESIKIKYDDEKISYSQLLNKFFRVIDITDAEGQFIDRGYQYSPAVFYISSEEKKIALKELEKIKVEGKLNKIAVKLISFNTFYNAEDYHQDYYKKNPIRYNYYRNRSGRNQYLEKIWSTKK
ncbi:MAG: peptide-methionine (S)-S-oxide reductase MsrA [Fusobacteriaceae bacterium]